MFFPLAMLSQYIFGPALFLLSLFIVLIILLQRGRGGGLTGALGGAGGASAFGVKAGDIFTRITAISVLLWIVLCALTCFWYLPDALNIASDPAVLNSGKSPNMGGMGSAGTLDSTTPDSTPLPVEIQGNATPEKALPAVGTAPSDLTPSDLPPAVTDPSVSTEAVAKPLPTDLPPASNSEPPVDLQKPTVPGAPEPTVPASTIPAATDPKL